MMSNPVRQLIAYGAVGGAVLTLVVVAYQMVENRNWAIWVEHHPVTVSAFTSALIAVGAVVAAWIALHGTRQQIVAARDSQVRQIEATIESQTELENRRREDQARALAAILWAELRDCRLVLFRNKANIQTGRYKDADGLALLREVDVSVYKAHQVVLGRFDPTSVYAAIQTYKLIEDTSADIREFKAHELAQKQSLGSLSSFSARTEPISKLGVIHGIDRAITAINMSLSGFARDADLPPDLRKIAEEETAALFKTDC